MQLKFHLLRQLKHMGYKKQCEVQNVSKYNHTPKLQQGPLWRYIVQLQKSEEKQKSKIFNFSLHFT